MNEGGCVRITQIKIRIGFFPFLIATRSLLTSLRARDRPENPMTHCPFHESNHLSTSLDTPHGRPQNQATQGGSQITCHLTTRSLPFTTVCPTPHLNSRSGTPIGHFHDPSNPPPTPPPLISFGTERHSVASRHGPFTVSACCKPVRIVL